MNLPSSLFSLNC